MFIFVLIMDIIYLRREIELSALLGEEPSSEVKELIKFFKSLTFRYEKSENDVETWYDENDQWTVEIWGENRNHSNFFYNNWSFLQEKYGLNYDQTSALIKDMLELTLNRKVDRPPRVLNSFFLKCVKKY